MPKVSKTAKVPSKLCIRCGKVLPLTDFYSNKAWTEQSYHDAWCKNCAQNYCINAESLKQYCFENNRYWSDAYYDKALKKAQYSLATDPEYLHPKTSQRKKAELESLAAARMFFGMMNMTSFYSYVDNIGTNAIVDAEASTSNPSDDNGKQLAYNKKWRGYFTSDQIDMLEDIYNQYEEDFVLDNVNIRDYARKVAKASLNADIAEDRMRRGEISAGEYKEAQRIFDDLSKSSNFAACRRKPGDSTGLGSLGEIVLRLEVSGALKENGQQFPEDDVDKIIADFRHTLTSIGLDGAV